MDPSGSTDELAQGRALLEEGSSGHVKSVIFLHMPKAAGSTLNQVIERQYPAGSVFAIGSGRQAAALETFKSLPWPERRKIRVLRGHIGFGLHDYLRPPVSYITILRDPVDRVLSHYYYLRLHLEKGAAFSGRPWLQEAGRMSLLDYVRHGQSADVRNGQTKLLAGRMAAWERDEVGQEGDTLMEKARQNLREEICVAGVRERFDETLVLLRRRLGWGVPFYVNQNVSEGRPDSGQIPTKTLDGIREENSLDIQIYGEVLQRFSETVQDEGPGFRSEVDRLRFRNTR